MSAILGLMIPIIAILCVFGVKAYRLHLQYHGASLSNSDRQLIDSLQSSAQRLESRVAMLERALLDAETPYASRTEV